MSQRSRDGRAEGARKFMKGGPGREMVAVRPLRLSSWSQADFGGTKVAFLTPAATLLQSPKACLDLSR